MRVPTFDLRVTDSEIRRELLESIEKVFDHGRLFLGPEVEEFEHQVAQFIGTKYAIGVSSGSSALYLALRAVGIGPGDEVITTPLTWIISSNAISACGATPVFVDVRDDFNIDPVAIESEITPRTKAIVPVHYAGHLCDMEAIQEIAERNNILLIEDAAQAFGAGRYRQRAGSFSIAAGFSMNPMKVLGGYGEAGVVVTSEEEIFKKIKQLRHAGTTSDPKKVITNDCREVALNHKMDTINAALLLVSLRHLSSRMEYREMIARRYNRELPKGIKRQESVGDEVHARYVYPIMTEKRNEFRRFLESQEIETKIMHEPLVCDAPVYKGCRAVTPRARSILAESLIIPSHEKLTTEQIDFVVDTAARFLDN